MKTRTEQWSTTSGPRRFFLVVLPVLALLVLVLLPATAQAERSSSEIIYGHPSELESVVPDKSHPRPGTNPEHHGSPTPTTGEDGTEAVTEPEGKSHSEGHHHSSAVPLGKGSNHRPGGGGGPGKNGSPEPAGGSDRKAVRNVSPGPGGPAPVRTETVGAGGGGSSPVLPVLIAMAVLAAASIGVVLYRQHRQDGGPEGYAG